MQNKENGTVSDQKLLNSQMETVQSLILDMSHVTFIDVVGVKTLKQVRIKCSSSLFKIFDLWI